jgi:SOUL heme-binding protein
MPEKETIMSKFPFLGLLLWSSSLMAIEQPRYSVLKDFGDGIEMRQYDAYIIAETEIKAADAEQAGNLAATGRNSPSP